MIFDVSGEVISFPFGIKISTRRLHWVEKTLLLMV